MGSWGLGQALREAGFSGRTAQALAYCGLIQTPEDLKTMRWGEPSDRTTLRGMLGVVPGLGPKGIAEIEAFRATGAPRDAELNAPTSVSTKLHPAELAALDRWIERQDTRVSRSQAVRLIVLSELRQSSDG